MAAQTLPPLTDEEKVCYGHPRAHILPAMGGFWVVTGTGYTMGWAKTELEAWRLSAKMLEDTVKYL
jgi:hypothetical protein